MAVGKDHIRIIDGAQQILRILPGRFAPDTTDAIYQEIAEFTHFEPADQSTAACLMEFDILREMQRREW